MQEDDVDDDAKGEEDDDVEEEEDDDVEEEDRSQDRGPHCARACAVERQEISQKPLYTEIYRKHAGAQSEPRTQKHARAQSERRVSPEQNTTVQDNDPASDASNASEMQDNGRQDKARQHRRNTARKSQRSPPWMHRMRR